MILLISDLPDVIFNAFSSQIPGWLPWGKVAVIAIFFGLTFAWKRIRQLRQFAVVFLVFYLALEVSQWVGGLAGWQAIFMGEDMTFTGAYTGIFIRDIGVALAVIAALWLIKRRREAFFLVTGQLDAPIEPVRWLGIKEGESWRVFGCDGR